MARKRVGLALSGGGARGFAHVGVIKVLAENDIPIDLIAGTSIGSVVGGALAAGMSADEIEAMAHSIRWRDLTRPSFSPIALLSNAPLGKFIHRKFPVNRFEDLKIPFGAVAVDLRKPECVVLKEQGDIVHAIRASCAVPAVFAPVREESGRILVDGGVMAPLPIDAVKKMGADVIIAVDLLSCGSTFNRAPSTAIGMMISSAMVLLRAASNNQTHKADVMIVPEIAHIRPDRLNQGRECQERGEESALAKIEEIKSLVSDKQHRP
jgi:NTE family protein